MRVLSEERGGAIKDMCDGVKTSVRTLEGDIEDFPIGIELYQGLALSLFLFTIIMDELKKGLKMRYYCVCYLLMMLFL